MILSRSKASACGETLIVVDSSDTHSRNLLCGRYTRETKANQGEEGSEKTFNCSACSLTCWSSASAKVQVACRGTESPCAVTTLMPLAKQRCTDYRIKSQLKKTPKQVTKMCRYTLASLYNLILYKVKNSRYLSCKMQNASFCWQIVQFHNRFLGTSKSGCEHMAPTPGMCLKWIRSTRKSDRKWIWHKYIS